jgi:hypothetical protein
MARKSEYKAGDFLVDEEGAVFIHDGLVNGDGYGCVIGESSSPDYPILRSSGPNNWCRYPVVGLASEEQIERLLSRIRLATKIEKY